LRSCAAAALRGVRFASRIASRIDGVNSVVDPVDVPIIGIILKDGFPAEHLSSNCRSAQITMSFGHNFTNPHTLSAGPSCCSTMCGFSPAVAIAAGRAINTAGKV